MIPKITLISIYPFYLFETLYSIIYDTLFPYEMKLNELKYDFITNKIKI
jgi:hypothetical protein